MLNVNVYSPLPEASTWERPGVSRTDCHDGSLGPRVASLLRTRHIARASVSALSRRGRSLSRKFPMRGVGAGRATQAETMIGRGIIVDEPVDVGKYRPHLGRIAMT